MFSFSWVIGSGADARGGNSSDADLEQILKTFELIREKSGSVTIDIIDSCETGPESLQIESENGKSVISLGENTSDDYVVRTFTNPLSEHKKICILGNEWDDSLVCEDSNLMIAIIKEFMTTGNVSKDILN